MRASDEPPGRRGAPTDAELLAMGDDEFDEATSGIASLLADGPAEIELELPSAGLWAAISSAVAADEEAVRSESTGVDPGITLTDGGPAEHIGDRGHDRRLIDPLSSTDESSPATSRARSRWGSNTAVLTLVAAVALLVLVPVGLSLRSSGEEPTVLARAELEVLTTDATRGSAELIADQAGMLQVDLEATAPEGEYLELWLLSLGDDGQNPVSLGRIDGSGLYAIPVGVDTSVFDIVDVSIEPDDGNPKHSGNSVLRGALTT